MTSRREVIGKLFKSSTALSFGGLIWGAAAEEAAEVDLIIRPPGALNGKDFIQACTKCGSCVEACPYDTLKLATAGEGKGNGTPYFEPRKIPCYMCQDIPCTNKCPSGALSIKSLIQNNVPTINLAKMGIAVIHKESCIAHWGIQCDACYRACPLIDEAIYLKREINKRTQKHANLLPEINGDACTGCGKCEHACVVEEAAIKVLPIKIATGKVGDHYIKGWDKSDEKRINENPIRNDDESDVNSALDYLNSDEDL